MSESSGSPFPRERPPSPATPDDVKARVASAYNHAADSYDHAANAFWERFGRSTVERLGMAPGSRVWTFAAERGRRRCPRPKRLVPTAAKPGT